MNSNTVASPKVNRPQAAAKLFGGHGEQFTSGNVADPSELARSMSAPPVGINQLNLLSSNSPDNIGLGSEEFKKYYQQKQKFNSGLPGPISTSYAQQVASERRTSEISLNSTSNGNPGLAPPGARTVLDRIQEDFPRTPSPIIAGEEVSRVERTLNALDLQERRTSTKSSKSSLDQPTMQRHASSPSMTAMFSQAIRGQGLSSASDRSSGPKLETCDAPTGKETSAAPQEPASHVPGGAQSAYYSTMPPSIAVAAYSPAMVPAFMVPRSPFMEPLPHLASPAPGYYGITASMQPMPNLGLPSNMLVQTGSRSSRSLSQDRPAELGLSRGESELGTFAGDSEAAGEMSFAVDPYFMHNAGVLSPALSPAVYPGSLGGPAVPRMVPLPSSVAHVGHAGAEHAGGGYYVPQQAHGVYGFESAGYRAHYAQGEGFYPPGGQRFEAPQYPGYAPPYGYRARPQQAGPFQHAQYAEGFVGTPPRHRPRRGSPYGKQQRFHSRGEEPGYRGKNASPRGRFPGDLDPGRKPPPSGRFGGERGGPGGDQYGRSRSELLEELRGKMKSAPLPRSRGLEHRGGPSSLGPVLCLPGTGLQWTLRALEGHVFEFAQDQYGSRFIQQQLESPVVPVEDKYRLFEEVLPHSLELCSDVFGNYVIQKLLDDSAGTREQQQRLCQTAVKGHLLELSLHMYGCRVVQKVVEQLFGKGVKEEAQVLSLEEQNEMLQELRGHVMQCVQDQNGNHVIQKCIEQVRPVERIAFILDDFTGQLSSMATHPYGCRVVQRLLEYCGAKRVEPALSELVGRVDALVMDQYGNYVVQHVVQHGRRHYPKQRQELITAVRNNLVAYATHKFASNVVEKCLQFGNASERRKIIAQMLGQVDGMDRPIQKRASSKSHDVDTDYTPLQTMMKDPYANYVVQKVLDIAEPDQLELVVVTVRENAQVLRTLTYGKHILTRMEKINAQPLPNNSGA